MENWLKYHTLWPKLQGDNTSTDSSVCSEHAEQPVAASDERESLHELHTSTSVVQESRASKSRIRNSKKHKFDDSYRKFGFMSVGDENAPGGQCVECNQVLTNSSLNPAKLRRHLETKHQQLVNKHIDYFIRKRDQLKQSCFHKKIAHQDNKNALESSYRVVSYHIAKAGEAHTIAESLLKSCMKDVVFCMFGEKYSMVLGTVPLSDDTISRRIKEMVDNCETVLINCIKTSPVGFTIQLDESTDVAGLAVLLVFVRYVSDESVHEDLLLCQALETTTRGEDIFKILDTYFTKNDLSWVLGIAVCTDGAKAMTGSVKGVIGLIKNVAPRHCCFHREALAVKKMLSDLKFHLGEASSFSSVCLIVSGDGIHSQNTLLHTELLAISW
ncbi:zinc finger BED domain-containing protein 5-like [Macrobrachium nipponense]|uniref:zinc finger BED domain-containing protein 5-like n=1 Tax=Macrobrachium nipponense TaxID=159736 RepID=UPI0030C7FCD7